MRTSYRDIFLLAGGQALLLVNRPGLITMYGLVDYSAGWLAVLRQRPATPGARPPPRG